MINPPPSSLPDSVKTAFQFDSTLIQQTSSSMEHVPWWNTDKPVKSDVQQLIRSRQSSATIILLIVILLFVTYLKIAFGKNLEELFQSVLNQNIAQQIFRSQSGELSLSSIILHINFIVVGSLFLQFVLTELFHENAFQKFSAIVFLTFLFTFFYLGKIFTLKFIGTIFEVQNETEEYLFHFTTICKTLGLTLFPALFVLAFTQNFFTNAVLIATGVIFFAFFLLFVFRGLSTARKIVYRNIYHFIIYVCIAEALPMFLFFKLLTKTIN